MVARGERDREAQTHACAKIKAPFSRSQNSSEQKSGREKRVGSMAEALRDQEDEEEARGGWREVRGGSCFPSFQLFINDCSC